MINILLTPRLTDNEAGHHYWYPRMFTKDHNPKNQVIYESSNTRQRYDKRIWSPVTLGLEWGHDLGAPSPLKIYITLLNIIKYRSGMLLGRVISFESSLSLVLALNLISIKLPRIKFHICLLDGGFWRKLLGIRPISVVLAKILRQSLDENRLFLYAQSDREAREFSKKLNLVVHIFPVISTLSNFITENQKPNFRGIVQESSSHVNLLILPTPDQLAYSFKVATELLSRFVRIGLQVRIHVKAEIPNEFQKYTDFNNRLLITSGSLEQSEYTNMFNWADIVYLPYKSEYHINGSSGKVIDALSSGNFVIVDSRFSLQQYDSLQEFCILIDDHNFACIESSIIRFLDVRDESSINHLVIKNSIKEIASKKFSLNNLLSELERLEYPDIWHKETDSLPKHFPIFSFKLFSSLIFWKILQIVRYISYYRRHPKPPTI